MHKCISILIIFLLCITLFCGAVSAFALPSDAGIGNIAGVTDKKAELKDAAVQTLDDALSQVETLQNEKPVVAGAKSLLSDAMGRTENLKETLSAKFTSFNNNQSLPVKNLLSSSGEEKPVLSFIESQIPEGAANLLQTAAAEKPVLNAIQNINLDTVQDLLQTAAEDKPVLSFIESQVPEQAKENMQNAKDKLSEIAANADKKPEISLDVTVQIPGKTGFSADDEVPVMFTFWYAELNKSGVPVKLSGGWKSLETVTSRYAKNSDEGLNLHISLTGTLAPVSDLLDALWMALSSLCGEIAEENGLVLQYEMIKSLLGTVVGQK
ncbi:MAG TPA: hypothetical protein O0X39_05395 [Methanocorpusculum sp.]|nr:hypothetical protein [Methanocorpusculum sp.]